MIMLIDSQWWASNDINLIDWRLLEIPEMIQVTYDAVQTVQIWMI